MTIYRVTQDVSEGDNYSGRTVSKGEILFACKMPTYGCVSHFGVSLTFDSDGAGPFFEFPALAVTELVLTREVQTCFACPSQWDAWDEDGNYYYLRYRFGHGTVSYWPEHPFHLPHRPIRSPDSVVIASFATDDALDGSISLADFADRAGIKIDGINYG